MKEFEKYYIYIAKNGNSDVNINAIELANEAFQLFKSLYDTDYGEICENENLISIHSGGWSYNEELIDELMKTAWWLKYHCITASGGHYYFNTNKNSDKEWKIIQDYS